MRGFVKILIYYSYLVICAALIELVALSSLYAYSCTNVFENTTNKKRVIDYDLYHPSVVRLSASGRGIIFGDSVVRALNYMLGDDDLVEIAEPIIDRLRQIQNNKDKFNVLMNFFGAIVSRYYLSPRDIEQLAKDIGIPEKFNSNLYDIIDVMREFNPPFGEEQSNGCSASIVSHNVVLTSAHCVFNRIYIGAYLGKNKYIVANSVYYALSSMGSSKKFLYDLAVVVFPDHTFDEFSPLKVSDSYEEDPDEIYGAIGIEVNDFKKKKVWGDVLILEKDKVYLASQDRSNFHSTYGQSGGPLINSKGQIVGIISGSGINDYGYTFDIYTKVLIEENYSFLQGLVRKNNIKINGVE